MAVADAYFLYMARPSASVNFSQKPSFMPAGTLTNTGPFWRLIPVMLFSPAKLVPSKVLTDTELAWKSTAVALQVLITPMALTPSGAVRAAEILMLPSSFLS